MRAAGIADPTKVVKAALRAAASAVSMLITTEALVLHRKPATAVEP
jgi:chaperonin GroEL (HSP60 family)